MEEDFRNEEDRIIENIVLDGQHALYDDLDFLPARQSLYNLEKNIAEYDDEIFQQMQWKRPQDISPSPVYFDPKNRDVAVIQGSLPDDVFLGALMAVCIYSKYDLIENIFASRPEDFLKYGVYTCRFYVNGEWVEVITDTLIPCLLNNYSSEFYPAYGRSLKPHEMWIPLVEKAFAKALGSYEAITTMKIQRALLHLTGGSVQQTSIRDDVTRLDMIGDQNAWNEFKRKVNQDCIILLLPEERKSTTTESAMDTIDPIGIMEGGTMEIKVDRNFIPNRFYSVITCRELGGYELVLMHNPWVHPNYSWSGEWSDNSNDWDLYPELLVEIEKDPNIPWRRKNPCGYFWISFRTLLKHFNKMFTCLLFPNEKYNFYCARGECRNRHAGGPLATIRDQATVLKDAALSRAIASQKSTVSVVIDGDSAWFNNPQYRISCAQRTTIYVSALPLGNGEDGDQEQSLISISVLSSPKHLTSTLNVPIHLWEVTQFETVATDKMEFGPTHVKGQETSIWAISLDTKHYYHIICNTSRKDREGDFILRVFSSRPVVMESLPPITNVVETGEWRRVGDLDTTGGPLTLTQPDGSIKENPKWCQNPQYHLQMTDLYGREEVYLKIVVRRTEHHKSNNRSHAQKSNFQQTLEDKKQNATVGLVICKADVLDENPSKSRKKQPRQNKLGETIPLKESSLKKSKRSFFEDENAKLIAAESTKTILRKNRLDPAAYYVVSSFSHKQEACIFYPKIPRSWFPDGLLVIPCLSEKGVKGKFDLEFYCSESIKVHALPDQFSRSMAGEWTEAAAGGSHLFPNWRKNPKFHLKITTTIGNSNPVRLRITLARHGANWRPLCKRDTVGCMIGFYIFQTRGTEQLQIHESTFVPDDELSTESNFSLPPLLHHDESYTIMPTTFHEGKLGSFVLTILCENEFHLTKENN